MIADEQGRLSILDEVSEAASDLDDPEARGEFLFRLATVLAELSRDNVFHLWRRHLASCDVQSREGPLVDLCACLPVDVERLPIQIVPCSWKRRAGCFTCSVTDAAQHGQQEGVPRQSPQVEMGVEMIQERRPEVVPTGVLKPAFDQGGDAFRYQFRDLVILIGG